GPPLVRPLLFSEEARLDRRLAAALDTIRIRALSHAHGLLQLGSDEVETDSVVGRETRREVACDELLVDRAPALLAVVVRARAPGQEAEPVAHPLELRAERV